MQLVILCCEYYRHHLKPPTSKNICVVASLLHVYLNKDRTHKNIWFFALPDSSVKDQWWLQRAKGFLLLLL